MRRYKKTKEHAQHGTTEVTLTSSTKFEGKHKIDYIAECGKRITADNENPWTYMTCTVMSVILDSRYYMVQYRTLNKKSSYANDPNTQAAVPPPYIQINHVIGTVYTYDDGTVSSHGYTTHTRLAKKLETYLNILLKQPIYTEMEPLQFLQASLGQTYKCAIQLHK